jgi:hypothetical protein
MKIKSYPLKIFPFSTTPQKKMIKILLKFLFLINFIHSITFIKSKNFTNRYDSIIVGNYQYLKPKFYDYSVIFLRSFVLEKKIDLCSGFYFKFFNFFRKTNF